ncbi:MULTISPECIES: DUF4126 domain-containing protein [Bizionia]|uniref:DUF4126 domain-containing protein n=1 Tax=Bizionia algoritergicola TaxID=291187 RepID=A0A5D0QY94_9FLAO|nr:MULTISPECIES: DUF4126 domain-containing protein [Bizionia]OBX21215.1 hypothetical protein BAA08_13635 [Bizionia sp. APA-3]TYB73765.1 DUF4126 domain-containing protein [Bizionia algoritergicola]
MTLETILSIFLGVGLAASVGFRVFVPLFALSLSAYFNVLELNTSWLWLGSLTAVITFGVATLFEIFAYYIPFFDNLLDTIAIPLAAIAGTAIVVSTTIDLNPVVTWSLAIIAGGGSATAIASTSSATRLASTATSAGFANPIVSTIETVMAVFMTIISLVLPVLALILVLVILALSFKIFKKFRTSKP